MNVSWRVYASYISDVHRRYQAWFDDIRAANPSANPSGTLQTFFRDIHKISGTFFHDNFMGQIRILHFENMLLPFAKLHLVSARATAGACELLQRFVVLFGFNWRSFPWRKLRRVDQVWMKFYILNMSLRADTDKKNKVCVWNLHSWIHFNKTCDFRNIWGVIRIA